MSAPDNPNNLALGAGIFVTMVSFVLMVLGCRELYIQMVDQEVEKKVLSVQPEQLRNLRAGEQTRLSQYQWADQKAGVVRLPLKRAAELTLRDWKTRAAAPAAADPNAAPAAAKDGTTK